MNSMNIKIKYFTDLYRFLTDRYLTEIHSQSHLGSLCHFPEGT